MDSNSCIALLVVAGALIALPGVLFAAGGPKVVTSEFIFEKAPFPSCHASTIEEVAPGCLLAAWFGGPEEGHRDVGIWLSRRDKDGWSAPVEVASERGQPCWNPVLFHAADGETLLFYKAGPSPETWSGFLKRSKDGGKTWGQAELLPAGILGPIKNKPIQLPNGQIVCGTSVESYMAWGCWVEMTPDGGRTWTRHGPINVPGEPYGIIQPTVFALDETHLRMLCRATSKIGRIAAADSTDGGRTWSQAHPIDLPNPNSGIDAVRLADGRVALIYNHTRRGRSPLNLGVSSDGGRTFKKVLDFETAPGEYSYPAIIQGGDGKLHVVYTWNRKRIRYAAVEMPAP